MSPIPSIQIPDVPSIPSKYMSNVPVTPKTPRSMLKNLFTWKKAPVAQDVDAILSPVIGVEERPQTAGSKHQSRSRKPSFSQRSQSDNTVHQQPNSRSRSKSRRRSRSRSRAVWDPPPLFQAYNQAFMHDTIQISNKGFLDWLPRNTQARLSARTSDSAEDDHVEVVSPSLSHRRSMSDSSTPSLTKKLFFLFENGHILQYKAEGSQDRLPERVLELSRDSVAFASDAISGQHWVLEVCPYGRSDEELKAGPSKSAWSRMTMKAPDTKRLTEKLLLVFDSPDTLFTWLIAIRKQIEGLGGLEYLPDSSPVLPSGELKKPTLRHATSEHFKKRNGTLLFSRSSTALPMRLDDPSEHEKDLPQLPAGLSYKQSVSVRSTAASSVATNTSLDRFRESYSGSSTAGTALSSDFSMSPTRDVFPPMLSPTLPREPLNTRLSPTTDAFPPMLSPTLPREGLSWRNIETAIPRTPAGLVFKPQERPTSPNVLTMMEDIDALPASGKGSEETLERPAREAVLIPVPIPQVTVSEGAIEPLNVRSPTTLSPAPIPELRKKARRAHRNMSASSIDIENVSDTQEASNATQRHTSKPSVSASKGSYGLFPKKLAMNAKVEPLVVPDQNHVPGLSRNQATDHLEMSESPVTSVAAGFGSNLFARANMPIKRPAPLALTRLLAPLEIDQPMRSPAVTDAMLDTNFGMSPHGTATQPTSPVEIRVPSFSDLKVDRSLLDSLRNIETKTTSPTPSEKRQSLTPRRSMPNFHYGSSKAPSAPVGPPPSGPLPAVPPVSEGWNSRNSTPNKRTSTQSTANRRASTKSIASSKKIRSPTPSFSLPSSQRQRSASVKSPILADTVSPIVVSVSSNKLDESAVTIGQVSIISAPPVPPLPTVMSKHKKSLSASSINSSQSKKTHKRSASSRSIHASISNLPLISHLITPPCGFETTTEFSNKSWFSVNGARSST